MVSMANCLETPLLSCIRLPVMTIQSNQQITFRDLYPAVYRNVTGSHVRIIDTGNFSLDTPVIEFFSG